MDVQKDIADKLGISRQRVSRLKYLKDESDADMRLQSPPSKGRERIVEIEREGKRYLSVREVAAYQNVSAQTVYRQIQKGVYDNTISYRGAQFILKSEAHNVN